MTLFAATLVHGQTKFSGRPAQGDAIGWVAAASQAAAAIENARRFREARQLADLKNPKDPIHEFLKTHSVQVLKPSMATHAKVFYNELDGSVR